jgi:hypothetical protein
MVRVDPLCSLRRCRNVEEKDHTMSWEAWYTVPFAIGKHLLKDFTRGNVHGLDLQGHTLNRDYLDEGGRIAATAYNMLQQLFHGHLRCQNTKNIACS